MKTILLTIAGLALGVAVSYAQVRAAKEGKTGAAAYDDFKEPYHRTFVSDWEKAVSQAKRRIAMHQKNITALREAQAKARAKRTREAKERLYSAMRRGVSRDSLKRDKAAGAKALAKKAKQDGYKLQSRLDILHGLEERLALLEKNNPPYFRFMPRNGNWSVGDIGISSNTFVLQVVSKDTFIAGTDGRDKPVMFRGFSTDGLVDDRQTRISQPIQVTGTVTYQTAIGGTKTVFVVEPLDLDSIKASADVRAKREAARKAAREAAEANKKAAEAQAWQERWNKDKHTWTNKSGKYSVEAIYDGYLGEGKIRLLRKDKSELVIHLSKLSEPDRRKAVALRRAGKQAE